MSVLPVVSRSSSLGMEAVFRVARRITDCLALWLQDLVARILACFRRTVVTTPLSSPPAPLSPVVLPQPAIPAIKEESLPLQEEISEPEVVSSPLPPVFLPGEGLNFEETWKDLVITEVDIHATVPFLDYLSPNESGVIGIQPLLTWDEPGLLVSTGTERSFFDLALSDPQKCTGLIVRDINPRVKAYVDFNTMLLRLATDRADYEQLSGSNYGIQKKEERFQKVALLSERLKASEMPLEIKSYYQKNLVDFAEIYFKTHKLWRNSPYKEEAYQGVQYHKEEQLFHRLQSFARAGRIIATTGDINDLAFLEGHHVGVIDVSNIPDYILMDFKGNLSSQTKVIWTIQIERFNMKTRYYISPFPSSLSSEEREEFDRLILKEGNTRLDNMFGLNKKGVIPSISLEVLTILRALDAQNMLSPWRPMSFTTQEKVDEIVKRALGAYRGVL